ncbi:MAG: hypothetical protein RL071_2514, partial [Pseudomonadota bacterium]
MRPTAPSSWARTLGLVLLLVALRLVALRDAGLFERDAEEGFNAAQAWMMRQGHVRDTFFIQYRPYCGGCTAQAGLAALLSTALPLSWLHMKLLPVGAWALALAAGQRWLHRASSPGAGLAFGLLMALPPRTPLVLSATGWANHMEAGCLAVALLAALGPALRPGPGRALLAGLIGGLALFTSFSGAFVAAGAALAVLDAAARGQPGALVGLGGLLVAPAGWLLQRSSSGQQPFHTIYAEDEWAPRLARIPDQLGTLLNPHQLAALAGHPEAPGGHALGVVVGISVLGGALALLWRGPPRLRGPVALAALWLAAYCLSGFSVRAPAPPELAYPGSLRYAAAVMPLCALILVAAARGGAGRLLALPALLSGAAALAPAAEIVADDVHEVISGQARPRSRPPVRWGAAHAADWAYVQAQLSYALPLAHHRACGVDDRWCRQVHAYAEGREAATAALRADPGGRCGVALDASALPAHPAAAWGAGEAVAQQLAARLDSGDLAPDDVLDALDACLQRLWAPAPAPAAAALRALVPLRAHPKGPARGGDPADPAGRDALTRALAQAPPALRAPLAGAWARACAPDPRCAPPAG